MLTLTANFDGEKKTLKVVNVTRNGSLHLEDNSFVNQGTLSIINKHPEIILHPIQMTGQRGDNLTFWQ